MNDHSPLTIPEFRGTFNRGEDEAIPPLYFRDSLNVRFVNKGVKTRSGSTIDKTLASVKRMVGYERTGEAKRLLILDGSGNLYDSTNLSTPVLSIAAMTDFSAAILYERAYISPHDGVTGLPGEKVYVYSGSGLARAAAGVAPSSFTLVAADSAVSGKVETGIHIIAVCYETASGYVTAPGGYASVLNAGSLKLAVSNIQTGPAGTIARILLSTRLITEFDGDYAHQTYYFIPDGTVANNTGTTLTVDFYDADLVDSADYLLEQMSEIPAGVGIAASHGYLVTWGEDLNSSIIRVSKSEEPESFNDVDGFITVNPGDEGGGVNNVCEYRTQIAIMKAARFYAVQPTTDPPANWIVASIDGSVGTYPHGLAKTLDKGAAIEDRLFLATKTGFRTFVGSFSPLDILSNPIDDIWARINPSYFHKVEVAVDPENFIAYIAVPLDSATSPNAILVCDYSEGLSITDVKWTTWTFPSNPSCIIVQLVGTEVVLKYGVSTGNVYMMDSSLYLDSGIAIDSFVEFPPFGVPPRSAHHAVGDSDDSIKHYAGARIRVRGVGTLLVTGKGADDAQTFTGESITLASAPGSTKFSGFNFTNEKCSIKLRTNGASERFTLTRFTLYMAVVWEDRPRG